MNIEIVKFLYQFYQLVRLIPARFKIRNNAIIQIIYDYRVKPSFWQPLLAGAMTYWVVQSEFNGCTAPGKANYSLNIQDKSDKDNEDKYGRGKHEREAIIILHPDRHIEQPVHQIFSYKLFSTKIPKP